MPSDAHLLEELLAAVVVIDAPITLVVERAFISRHLAAVASHCPAHLFGYCLEESRVALWHLQCERVNRHSWCVCHLLFRFLLFRLQKYKKYMKTEKMEHEKMICDCFLQTNVIVG